ncbi:hypothetical protein TRVA0_041S00188 [Trichomonascus vanleenenianus]|uniref:uncharacterized protein n=1 Tax=Trichomonascus vanleenenianus TaxID=2268995 RepID=UPI003ECAB167
MTEKVLTRRGSGSSVSSTELLVGPPLRRPRAIQLPPAGANVGPMTSPSLLLSPTSGPPSYFTGGGVTRSRASSTSSNMNYRPLIQEEEGEFLSDFTPTHENGCSYFGSTDREPMPPKVPGFGELHPIYPHYVNSVSMYRTHRLDSQEPVLIKVSTKGSLEDLTRIRHEWSMVYPQSQSADDDRKTEVRHKVFNFPVIDRVQGILRPEECIRIGSNPARVVLVYPNSNNLVTLRERYISALPEEECTASKKRPNITIDTGIAIGEGSNNCMEANGNCATAANSVSPTTSTTVILEGKIPSNTSPNAIRRSSAEVKDILRIMIQVTKTIAKLHKHNVTHNGLTSSTIFVDEHGNPYISGWDFSFPIRAEDTSRGYRKTHLKQIADCMGYVSPETTGLINRLVDFRADFYSIGCILYELLLGFLPFRSTDPSELSHMHVLRTPVAPSLLASWIPGSLSQVVMKLLEKNADERYQSARLVVSDLELILAGLERDQNFDDEDFEPASEMTVSPVFMVPQLIYGREMELSVLHSSYQRNEKDGFQFVFCLGEPGSGKSRLINELERSSISRNTFFCVSKFDQYQRGAPFYSIVTVLKDIVHQILSGSMHSITQWRDNIISNLKVDLSVLFGPIPELKELLGYEYLKLLPKSQPMGPVPKEMRFKFVVKSLFCLFGAQGLTVFLDDIQWCPYTELSLFRELTTFAIEKFAGEIHITFVCASTRDNKSRYQSLVRLATDLNVKYEHVNLSPLSFEAVRELVNDTLGPPMIKNHRKKNGLFGRQRSRTADATGIASYPQSAASTSPQAFTPGAISQTTGVPHESPTLLASPVDPQVQSLTETVYQVTNGNPLFITLLLKYLYYEQYIFYDDENRITSAKWRVDFDRLSVSVIPKSVTDVVITMMKKLPKQTVRILRYAACICSNTFTLEDLAVGANVSFSEAANALHYALDFQLILPITIHYKFPFLDPVGSTNIELYDDEIRRVAAESTYRFYHDLVQQAVYSLLDEREALEVHRSIGMRLLGEDPDMPKSTQKVIEIANQMKIAVAIVREDEKEQYIDLNVRAGNVVYGMSDFDMAYGYFNTARSLLPPDYHKSMPDVSKEIFLNLTELQYNRKNYDDCLELVNSVFQEFPTDLDKAALLRTKTKALYGLCRTDEAIKTGLEALKLLGFNIEESEGWNKEYHESLRPRIPISVSEIRELVHLKSTEDPRFLLLHEVISIITIPVILSSRRHLFRSLVYTSIVAFLDHGSSASCSFSLLSLASLFQGDGGNANLIRAYEYSKLAIVTLDSDSAVGMDFGINIYEYYALTLAIYFEPLSEVIRYYDLVLSSGQTFEDHCGMLSLSYDLRPLCKFLAGEPLSRVFEYFRRIKPVSLQPGDDTGELWIQLHTQGMCNMMGNGNVDPSNLEGAYFGDRATVRKVLESSSTELKYAYYVLKLTLAVIYRYRYIAADIICNDLPKLISQVPVTVYHVVVTFYGALAIIDKTGTRTEAESELLNGFVQDLEDWSRTCPAMFLHKYLLVKAEMNRNTCNSIITLDTYEDAIKGALSEGFIQEAAIINERCGYHLQYHSKKRSLTYLKEACRLYTLWGAQKKITQITTKYPELLATGYDISRLSLSSTELTGAGSGGTSGGGGSGATASGGGLLQDILQRPSLSSNNVVVQNSSPLRWILSNLFRETLDDGTNIDDRNHHRSSAHGIHSDTTGDGYSVSSNQGGNKQGGQDFELKTALQACLEISESIDMNAIIVKLVESVMKTSGADYCVYISYDDDNELYVDSIGMLNGVNIMAHEALFARNDVAPLMLVQQVITTGSSVVRGSDAKRFDTVYGRDHYFHTRHSQSVLCMPIQNQIKVIGALYMEHQSLSTVFSLPRIELIGLLSTQAAVSIEKSRLYHQMDLAKKTAEEATAEKASFLANMSHEIRTPFNALLSCSIFLLDTELSEMQREYVETIRSSAVLTLNIIDAILAFSKIEHGSITLDNSPFSLRECVESAIQLVAEPAATKDLELVHLNKCGEIDTIYGDVTRVRQIIINLVGNAVKFTSKGHIIVETTAEKVSSDNRYEFVISVTDTGIGIPKNARNKIFRAFSQVDGSSRRVYGGSGLGLAISKKLAELMGGSLTFESKEGVGTTFWFSLVVMAQKPSSREEMRMYQGKRCLIADHHQTAKESLQTEVERLGFAVDLCSSSREAAEIVRRYDPGYYSLVFLDSKLMEHETCEESKLIKTHSRRTQVVYMTIFGSALPDNTEDKGISAILMRPVQRSRLHQIIRKVLHSSVNIQSQVKSAATTFDKGIIQTLAIRHPLKILLAEDNPINTRVALQHLKRMGYNADHAKDGVEVLDMCERELVEGRPMYDVILMDIQMPNKDGIAASQELFEKYDARTRPSVIALTANAAGEDRQKCLDNGMVNYIAKPILPTDLAAVLMGVKPLKEMK